MTATPSRHATSLTDGEIVEENDLGSIRRVTADSFPILSGMSIKRIMLNPGAMRTPHWHANANELTYCVSGTSLVSVLDTYSKFSSFTVGAGEMFHIDSGSLHHIENIGEDAAELILAFRSERPEDFGLAAAFGAMTDAVLGNTCDLPASDFAKIRRDTTDRALAARSGDPVVTSTAHFDDPHKFAIEAQSPPIGIAVGSARLARLQFWPALKDLSMYSLRIREEGMREPHWHPITAEMGMCVAKGKKGWTATGNMAANGFGEHSPGGYSLAAVIVAEIVLTGMFLLVILGSTDNRAPKGFAGLSIGLTLTLIHLISIPISNTSVNPARSTGVAFFNGDGAQAQLWVFWLAPLVGAAIAGIAYPHLFGRNEELADRPARDDAMEDAATT
ncbi:MAG: oxalate decarboxylase [Mycobacterium sp.]|uniref:cupin domain-containing protein n=1 Tax=Mycobacterium sp. TaxID=1785 RepID=UPI0028BC4F86|nr:oxalate decarboxylase [Mycobacterium sp.]